MYIFRECFILIYYHITLLHYKFIFLIIIFFNMFICLIDYFDYEKHSGKYLLQKFPSFWFLIIFFAFHTSES